MKKAKLAIIITICGVCLLVASVTVFYSLALVKVVNLANAANNGVELNFEDSTLISFEDFKTFQSVSPIQDKTVQYYVNGGTFYSIHSVGI